MKKWMQNRNLAGLMIIVLIFAFAASAFAAALTADRTSPERAGQMLGLVQGSNTIFAGALVAVNTSGVAVPASDAAGLKVLGRAEVASDNTGANYLATKTLNIRRGVFRFENGGSFTAASIGALAYVQDDQTVTTAAAATNDIIAGLIVDVDSTGVWVDTLTVGGQGAASLTTLNVSGAASVGGAFTGSSTISGTGFKLGDVAGFTGGVTNVGVGKTNFVYYAGGIVTNVVTQ